MYHITPTDLQFAEQINSGRESRRAKYHEILQEQNELLDVINQVLEHVKALDLGENQQIWNIIAFFTISRMDMATLLNEMSLAEHEWSKRFYIRMWHMHAFECIQTLRVLFGKEFKLIQKLVASDQLAALRTCKKRLNVFFNQHGTQMTLIRNNTIAHSDKDANKQIQMIMEMNWSDSIALGLEFALLVDDIAIAFNPFIQNGIKRLKEL